MNQYFINPFNPKHSLEVKVFFLLRLGMWMCFVGHGFWGMVHKEAWFTFFELFNISWHHAQHLMPVIGCMDILVGFVLFFHPNWLVLTWAAFWTIFTAALRPLNTMGMSEFFERAGNFGPPIALILILVLSEQKYGLIEKIKGIQLDNERVLRSLELCLRLCLFSLLAGHAGLAIFNFHPTILQNFSVLGIHFTKESMILFGVLEMLLALVVLFKPKLPGLMIFVLFFKIGCEILFPISGRFIDIFETLERGGDYVIPLILHTIYQYQDKTLPKTVSPQLNLKTS